MPPTDQDRWRIRDLLKPPFRLDLVWLVLPFALALICFGLLPLRSWDYWWHISMGRLIDHWLAVPDANHFLYTIEADAPSYVQPWMSQWMLFWLHDVVGVHLSLLVRNVLAALVFGGVTVAAVRRSQSALRGSLATLVGFLLAFQLLAARTHMFVWPLFALALWMGYAIRRRKLPLAALVVLPAVAALWANLHGSFFVVAAICLAFLAAASFDRFVARKDISSPRLASWAGALVASIAAPMLNPRGTEIYGYVFDLMGNAEIQSTVSEWMATTLSNPPGIGPIFYVVVVAGLLLLWQKRSRLDAADAFLFLGFAAMAALSARSLLWFGIAAPVLLARYIRSEQPEEAERPGCALSLLNVFIALGLVVGGFVLQPGTTVQRHITTAYQPLPVRTRPPMAGVTLAETPVEHTEILGAYRQGLRVFHDQKYAGYLIYHLTGLQPRQVVFVDQRIELPPADIWRQYETINTTSAWKGIFRQYGIEAAVLSFESQLELINRMRKDDNWVLVHEDDHNALFVLEP